ncbi:xanthine dehydrogenase family protein molybdopterin-binding subunit [Candidatus Solirubrobacter pratensis]|uniref:xanthine dehydrogenase family protein molybdopterin-binding subunit n=1 Tax=Candidatus Solirubrobacter pratensis TaxID=1298857 RepID=UPI000426B102|nr:xanthine dehydrogenase family protein molybdopterin-binding subunit [Candidatus Solirubrobacter pratensis]
MTVTPAPALGAPLERVESREKVAGEARYAYEYGGDDLAYAWIVGATVARGSVRAVHAPSSPGLIAVLSHSNAPVLRPGGDPELLVLQSPAVAYRGQVVALVVAESLEEAREAARLVRVEYDAEPHDVLLRPDHPKLYKPDKVNPAYPTDTEHGDFDAAFAAADVRVDATYETPALHNNPIEPHATTAMWDGGGVTLYDATQGAAAARGPLADVLGLEPEQVRVIAPHVGGGFGSKGTPRPNAVLAALAAKATGRPVKLAVTRQQMFKLTGYRTPTIQRLRLGASADGRLKAIAHEVAEQSSTLREFAEQTAVATRMMYAGANRRTAHRLVRLDVPTPSWMRAPGECPGMFALESAIDELAAACGIDPVELRIRNEPERAPEEDVPFSSRHLVACLREGAARFGWASRARRRRGPYLYGSGVAASTYPAMRRPARATARELGDGRYEVRVAAADIGTGARTVLTQIAADALGVDAGAVTMQIGDSAFGPAPVAGGSAGTASWGSAVAGACRVLREQRGGEAVHDTAAEIEAEEKYARHAFGAQFVEARVDTYTGEVRVERMLGAFAAGHILNPRTAHSQFVGAMTMGVGMALFEESVLDLEFGDYLNHDLSQYHVPVHADIRDVDAVWLEEEDPHLNPMGSKGIGEIGIVGAAAAVANAVHDATGIRFRSLPLRPDRVLDALERA